MVNQASTEALVGKFEENVVTMMDVAFLSCVEGTPNDLEAFDGRRVDPQFSSGCGRKIVLRSVDVEAQIFHEDRFEKHVDSVTAGDGTCPVRIRRAESPRSSESRYNDD